jgi:hypothetical protein
MTTRTRTTARRGAHSKTTLLDPLLILLAKYWVQDELFILNPVFKEIKV